MKLVNYYFEKLNAGICIPDDSMYGMGLSVYVPLSGQKQSEFTFIIKDRNLSSYIMTVDS